MPLTDRRVSMSIMPCHRDLAVSWGTKRQVESQAVRLLLPTLSTSSGALSGADRSET